ncbi:MAG TPA: glycosyltransferase [Verrucomicrobiae bacterium]|nr:glycosyltransferase [Verrucomicrobiae bacterium]
MSDNVNSPAISVIVATRNRVASLRRLLASLDRLQPPPVPYETVIVDNGSTDDTPRVLGGWAARGGARQTLRVEQPGKSRALNAAIKVSHGDALVFVDDDVVVDPSHLRELWDYFATHDCAAAQGAVLWPPEAKADPDLRQLLQRYRSCIVRADFPPDTPQNSLRGANIAVRRAVFEKVGPFNECLGPGAAGFSEDDELADRIRATGGWIGYVRRAEVVHEIDRSRLTEEYFRRRHRLQGRSRFLYKQRGLLSSILPNMVKAAFYYVYFGLVGDVHRQYRAKGRWFHYREMLEMTARRRGSSPSAHALL